jgi:hypothetical protein
MGFAGFGGGHGGHGGHVGPGGFAPNGSTAPQAPATTPNNDAAAPQAPSAVHYECLLGGQPYDTLLAAGGRTRRRCIPSKTERWSACPCRSEQFPDGLSWEI